MQWQQEWGTPSLIPPCASILFVVFILRGLSRKHQLLTRSLTWWRAVLFLKNMEVEKWEHNYRGKKLRVHLIPFSWLKNRKSMCYVFKTTKLKCWKIILRQIMSSAEWNWKAKGKRRPDEEVKYVSLTAYTQQVYMGNPVLRKAELLPHRSGMR